MKQKICHWCKKTTDRLWYSNPPTCMDGLCRKKAQEQRSSKSGTKTPERKESRYNSSIKAKPRKATGEYGLFLKIYAEKKGVCEITKKQLPFNVNNFAHILSKGAYPNFRLNPENIAHVDPDIHHLYDNSSKEKLLEKYPGAEIIYKRKADLKFKYYNQ